MRRDFEKYFTKLQLQYNQLQKDLEKVNKEISEGLVTEEQKTNFMNYFNAVKANYDRVSYARYLLRLPPKFIQKIQSKIETRKMAKELEKYKKEHADQDSVLEEGNSAREEVKEILD